MKSDNPRKYSGQIEGPYDARSYFEKRLSNWKNLRGTGHRRFSLEYNQAMYEVALLRLQNLLNENHIDVNGKKVLDIGPGVGYFVEQYINWGAKQVTGLDITQVSVDFLKQKFPGHEFIRADISDEPTQLDRDYDLCFAISIIFHIVQDIRFEMALENMCHCIQKGGHLIIVDSFERAILRSGKHVRLRAIKSYQPILEKNGFKIITIKPMYYVMGQSFFPYLLPNLLSWAPVTNLLKRFDYWLGNHIKNNATGLKFLLAVRMAENT